MLKDTVKSVVRPIAKRVLFNSVKPGPVLTKAYQSAFYAQWVGREVYEWGWRALVATPVFLSRCAVYGDEISVDRIPYMQGNVRVELGSKIRFSGQVIIASPNKGEPLLRIGNGVFVGHHAGFSVAERIEIGDFTSIGGGSQIADTEGHAHYNPNKPIWEVPAGDADIAPVIIEDNVQIGRNVMILKGVTIGARSVIGAGAIVRKSIPPDSIVMGNPGRVVKRIQPEEADSK